MTLSKVTRKVLSATLLLFAVNILLVTLLGGYGWSSDAPNGVFYFPSEPAFKLTEKMPGTKVVLMESEESAAISSTEELVYRWDAKERTLVRHRK